MRGKKKDNCREGLGWLGYDWDTYGMVILGGDAR